MYVIGVAVDLVILRSKNRNKCAL